MSEPRAADDDREIDLTVAVTCYNEEAFISATLESVTGALAEVGCSYEIIVVDDASRDDSVRKIKEYIAAHPDRPIRLQANKTNRGLGNNYVEAAFLGRGKYYRLTAGDDGEPKDVLVNVFQHIGKADMIIPYNSKPVVGKSRMRNFLSAAYTFLVNLISGYHVGYYNGLAIHLRYNVLRWHSRTHGFAFQADLITRLLDEGASYAQVPSSSDLIDRKGDTSTALSMKNVLSVGHTLLEIGIRRLRNSLFGRKTPWPIEVSLEAPTGQREIVPSK